MKDAKFDLVNYTFKTINNKKIACLEVSNKYELSRVCKTLEKIFYYIINPPRRLEALLINRGFIKSDPLVLLITKNLKHHTLPTGYYYKNPTINILTALLDFGEEKYPEWLKHDISFYREALMKKNMKLFIVIGRKNEIVGKIITEIDKEVCKIRAVGVKMEYRGLGIGKALVSKAMTANASGNKYSAISLQDSVKFWEKLGFKKDKNLPHWIFDNRPQTIEDL
jgi:N-acetylglutamate synthase-like GNAT family acetyltransferase